MTYCFRFKKKNEKPNINFTLLTCLLFWCWLQELVCSCADIVPANDDAKCELQMKPDAQQSTIDSMQHQHQVHQHANYDASSMSAPNPVAMFRTIAALLTIAESNEDNNSSGSSSTKQTHATNTNTIGNQCEAINDSIDEIDHYTQYFKEIGIHFQKTTVQLLNQQHPPPASQPPQFDSCIADVIDSDHRNEYSFIDNDDDNFDCHASNASANPNVVNCDDYDDANNYAMQSSLCNASSANNTNQQQSNAQYEHEIGFANDCSSSNSTINHIENNNASNNSSNNNDVEKISESNPVRRPDSVQIRRKTPNTLNLNLSNNTGISSGLQSGSRDIVSTKKRKVSHLKRTYKQMNSAKLSERQALNEITEECEYDSDIGKFNCKPSADQQQQQLMSDTSSGSYEFSEDSLTIQTIGSPSSNDDDDVEHNLNDLNLTPKQQNHETAETIELLFNINGSEKIVTKRIEFFENISGKSEIEQDEFEPKQGDDEEEVDVAEPKKCEISKNDAKQLATLNDIICFSSFVFALVFMYFFPVLC